MKRSVKWRKMTWQLRVGLAVVALLALIKFGWIPLFDWREETLLRINLLKESVGVKKALIGKKSDFQALLAGAKSSDEALSRFYYKDFTDPQSLQLRLQKQVERLASSHNVEIKSTEWLYASEGDVVRAPIKLVCAASVDDIIRLVAELETDRKFLSVDRLRMISRPTAALVNAEMNLSAYGIKEGGEKP